VFDADAAQAAKTRIAFLDQSVADNALVVVRDGSAYRWLPAEWRRTA